MKQISIIILLSLLSSCVDIRFETPQPNDYKIVETFPRELIGKYVSDKEISGKTLKFLEKEKQKQQENTRETITELSFKDSLIITETRIRTTLTNFNKELSDSLILKKLNDSCYVVSLAKKDSIKNLNTWYIHPVIMNDNKLTIYSMQFIESYNDSTLLKLEELIEVEKVCGQLEKKKRKKKDVTEYYEKCYYLINPSTDKFIEFIDKGLFKEWIVYNKLNKKRVLMYIQNGRDSSKFKGCSPLQPWCNLISLKLAFAYFAYTQHLAKMLDNTYPNNYRLELDIKLKLII